jgi:hypothetical protein
MHTGARVQLKIDMDMFARKEESITCTTFRKVGIHTTTAQAGCALDSRPRGSYVRVKSSLQASRNTHTIPKSIHKLDLHYFFDTSRSCFLQYHPAVRRA